METFSKVHPLRLKKLKNYIKHLPGLTGYWPMWEKSDSVTRNYAPLASEAHTNNGTVTGAVQSEGKAGKSLSFDGTDDGIAFMGFVPPSTTLSVGFLYARTAAEDANDRILDWQDAGPANGFAFIHPAATTVQFVVRNDVTSVAAITSAALTQDQFYFLVATYEVNSVKFFMDGVQQGVTDTSATMTAAAATLTAMKRATAATNLTAGKMQHLFVVNGVLTQTQITKLAKLAGV